MKKRLREVLSVMICDRAVNAAFVAVNLAGMFGVPGIVVLGVSAGLYAVLVVRGVPG